MSNDVPATLRAAIRRLQRKPLGRSLDLSDEESLGEVFPIAWALGTDGVGVGALHPRPRIAVVVDEDTGGNGLRWYGLIPTLLGAGKSCRVTQVIARYQRDRERRAPAALLAVGAPAFAVGSVLQLADAASPPSTIVFADADRGSGLLLRELTHPRIAQWLAGGTEILLLADSDISLLFMMQAIEDLSGDTGMLYPREPKYLGGGGSVFGRNVACRLLRAPVARPGCGAVAARMSANLDIILATMTAGAVATENEAMNFGISAPGRSLDAHNASFMMLPFRFLYTDLRTARTDGGLQTVVMSLDDLTAQIAVAPEQMPSSALLERHDVEAWLQRYRLALVMYRDLVSPTLETVFGVYAVDDQGELIVREGGPEHHDLLNEQTWHIAADWASVPERMTVIEAPLEIVDAQSSPATQATVDPTEAIGDASGSTQVSEQASLQSTAPDRAVDDALAHAPDASRAALVETIRELQHKLRVVIDERDEARRVLAAVTQSSQASHAVPAKMLAPIASPPPARSELPATWDELFIWAHRNYAHAIAFTSRARRAARKSVFRDIAQAAEAIELLAHEYRNVRVLGDAHARQAFEERLRDSGFSVGPTGQAVTSHQTAELYAATWEGRRYRLDTHLQGSSARDKTRGLRVYFAWLPERAMILVGHMPTHLRNSLD